MSEEGGFAFAHSIKFQYRRAPTPEKEAGRGGNARNADEVRRQTMLMGRLKLIGCFCDFNWAREGAVRKD